MHTMFKRVGSTTNPKNQQELPSEVLNPSGSVHHQWECLDVDLVFVVLHKLLEPIDRVRFGAVCKQWGRFAQDYKQRYKRESLPMLLIPIEYNESSQEWRYGKKNRQPKHQGLLYSVSERRVYKTTTMCRVLCSHRLVYRRYYRGCGHGWVAMIDRNVVGSDVIITLVNPFTTAMLHLLGSSVISKFGIPKVTSSGDPASNPDNSVHLIFSDISSWIIVGGRGRLRWTECRPNLADIECRFTDAMFYRGKIYMADCSNCGIVVIDYKDRNRVSYASPPSAVVQSLNFPQRAERAYLVESVKGDLLYVQRFAKLKEEGQMETESFRVYKVMLNGSIVEYEEVKSIGDEAFFVGDSPSVSVLASTSSGCQPNSIYFTDDSINYSLYSANYFDEDLQDVDKNREVQVDMGVFHLEDGTISQHYPKYSFDGRLLPPPLWIMPPAV